MELCRISALAYEAVTNCISSADEDSYENPLIGANLSTPHTEKCLWFQGRSHQNVSGQVEIISQGLTYSDFQIIVIVVHSMYSTLQGHSGELVWQTRQLPDQSFLHVAT